MSINTDDRYPILTNLISDVNDLKHDYEDAIQGGTTVHDHDERYYDKITVDNKIAGAVTGGSVDLSNYYTKQQVDTSLNGKSNTSHTHSIYSSVGHGHSDLYYDKATVDTKIANAGGGGTVDLSSYQTKSDNTLTTTAKTVVGAINENKSSLDNITNNFNEHIQNHPSGGESGIWVGNTKPTNNNVSVWFRTYDTNTYGQIVLSKTTTTIVEGQSDTFTVKLDTKPTNNQIVYLNKDNSDVTLNPTLLTFTPSNWNIAQSVTINVAEDNTDYSNESCTITLSSFNVTTKTLVATITDNDTAPTNIPVTGIALDKTTHTFKVGETVQLVATIQPTDATNKAVTWTSSNTNIATVTSNGLVTAKVEGSATITVTTSDGSKTATCILTIQAQQQVNNPIQDGLIYWLDGRDGQVGDTTWTDRIGSNVANISTPTEGEGFTGNGNVKFFNSYMRKDLALSLTDFTIEVKYTVPKVVTGGLAWSMGPNGSNNTKVICNPSSGYIENRNTVIGECSFIIQKPNVAGYIDTEYHHFVVYTHDDGVTKIYDGNGNVLVTNTVGQYNNVGYLGLNKDGLASLGKTIISSVKIYNKALTTEEISTNIQYEKGIVRE